jgi:hypothetical protein
MTRYIERLRSSRSRHLTRHESHWLQDLALATRPSVDVDGQLETNIEAA